MNKILSLRLRGRAGNQMMTYLFARAYAEQYGMDLFVEPWFGSLVFDIHEPQYDSPEQNRLPELDENTIDRGGPGSSASHSFQFKSYCQQQKCMLYTKVQAQCWLTIRQDIFMACEANIPSDRYALVAHRRSGDYKGYGYVECSHQSYLNACREYGLDSIRMHMCREENPFPHFGLPDELSWLPDFYLMMHARTLLRGNSTFSWMAALLGRGLVLSPVIDGLAGGLEHDVRFVPGNHPRFADLPFITDLHVK